jgi:hypothetical protein
MPTMILARIASIAVLILAMPAVAGETTLPGSDEATFRCQFLAEPGVPFPHAIKAYDESTGEILLQLQGGESVPDERCIVAPHGHRLRVIGEDIKNLTAPKPACPVGKVIRRVLDFTQPQACSTVVTRKMSCPPDDGPCSITLSDTCRAPTETYGCFTQTEIDRAGSLLVRP